LAEDLSLTLSRGEKIQVPIESIREGEVPGTHEVTWDSEEDTIVITHIAKGRRGFALGAVLAAEKIVG
jgi:4-hydroxy-tetrahydrodipicolinate reductase